jgi:protein-tyrosine phosphatase
MTGYFDIHAHVLPGIDDGPSEVDDALAMLRAAAGCGIATIVATPHVRSDFLAVDVHQLADRGAEMRGRTAAGLQTRLYELQVRGFRITLAHPERSRDFQRDPAPPAELVRRGLLLQVNADTLLGNEGRSATSSLGVELCLDGLVHALASDSHRAESWRPVTRLPEAVAAAASLLGPDRARWMSADAPAAIFNGAELPEAPPVLAGRRRRPRWPRR